MESFIQLLQDHAANAHFLIFFFLLLAGFNVPISEDLMVIIAASLAASAVPENTYLLFTFTFLGCYLSDWICYGIGRKFGKRLWEFSWFARTIPKKRLDDTKVFYEKYGFLTLLVGRFIPFGVRNCLFLSAGMGKMPFKKFLFSDGIACFTSNLTLFYLTYTFNKNINHFFYYVKQFNLFLFLFFVVTIIAGVWYKRRNRVRFDQ